MGIIEILGIVIAIAILRVFLYVCKKIRTTIHFLRRKKYEVNVEIIKEKLKKYIDAGLIKDLLYETDKMCIFNYADTAYIGFPYVLYNNEYPLGMIISEKFIEEIVIDPKSFFMMYKEMYTEKLNYLLHLSDKNIKVYADGIERAKKNNINYITKEANEFLKSHSRKQRHRYNESSNQVDNFYERQEDDSAALPLLSLGNNMKM